MPDSVWYLFQDGTQQGPMSLEALRVLADEGKLKPDGLVTRPGMTDWLPARSSSLRSAAARMVSSDVGGTPSPATTAPVTGSVAGSAPSAPASGAGGV